ncbi:hypothetical protein [Micromonospora sp. NPDC004704]
MHLSISTWKGIMTINSSASSTSVGRESATDTVREVGAQAAQAGRNVTATVKEQGGETLAEATRQARNLYGEARGQLASQAGEQQRRTAGGLRSLADEMRAMAEQGGQSGPVSEFARQAAERIHVTAGWLEEREPGDLLTEVRAYARRNPATFLVGAALLGVVAGRLTRNMGGSGVQDAAAGDHGLVVAETAPPANGSVGQVDDASTSALSVAAPASQSPTTQPARGMTRVADPADLEGLSSSSPAGVRP